MQIQSGDGGDDQLRDGRVLRGFVVEVAHVRCGDVVPLDSGGLCARRAGDFLVSVMRKFFQFRFEKK